MSKLSGEAIVTVELVLCDRNPEVLEGWRRQFERHPDVRILEGSVVEAGTDACVCPGNAFGFMDGGLALHISETLGWELQDRLRERVYREHDGELLVGEALVLPTGRAPAWLVYAPTLRTAGGVEETLNAYLAMRGALIAVRNHNRSTPDAPIRSLAVSGLSTGAGGLHPHTGARQLRYAWEQMTGLRGLRDKNLSQLARREKKLRAVPASASSEDAGADD